MSGKQTRRLLVVAFALSLLVHLVAVVFVRWPRPRADDMVAVVHVIRIRPLRIAHVATPPPPTPTPAPTAAPTRRITHIVAHVRGRSPLAPAASAPAKAPVPLVSPRPTTTPNCATADTPVTIAATAPTPDIPAAARGAAVSGTARVRVTVDPNGTIAAASLAQSSGDSGLDLAALAMARSASYAPATHACKPVAAEYVYAVKFVAW